MENKEFDLIVDPADAHERVDVFVSKKTGTSRAMMQKLIADGQVLLNNQRIKPSYVVKTDDRIYVRTPVPKEYAVLAEDIPLKIVYEDKDIVVVDKPAGMIVHPASGIRSGTLVNALMRHIKDLSSIGGELKPGIVHRLDKDTSGLLVVAKNDNAHINLQKQIKDRQVKKIYRTLVFGAVKPKSGVIEKPIGRHPVHRKKMAVILDSKLKSRQATTYYKVIKEYKGYSLLELDIKTGRTHQIRVHLSYLGYPVVGDKTYTHKKNDLGAKRQLLHSHILGFRHPATGKYMEFKSEIPSDFAEILNKLD